jgi:hypothetical protein
VASLSWINDHRARRGEPLLCVCGGDIDVRELAGGVFLCSACRQAERAFDPDILLERRREDAREDQ